MYSQTFQILVVATAFLALIGFVLFLTKQSSKDHVVYNHPDQDDLLGTGNVMIAAQIKKDAVEIRMEVDDLMDRAIKLNEQSRGTLENLKELAKDEPITGYEFKMLARQVLKEFQEIRNAHPEKDYEYIIGRAIKVLIQLA